MGAPAGAAARPGWPQPRHRAAQQPAPAPGPTSAAARCHTTGRPAARPPGWRRRQRHRRTTARQAFQTTAATMPAPGHRAPGEPASQPARPGTGPQPQPPGSQATDSAITSRAAQLGPGQPTPPYAHASRTPNRTPAARPETACSHRTSPTPLPCAQEEWREHASKPGPYHFLYRIGPVAVSVTSAGLLGGI